MTKNVIKCPIGWREGQTIFNFLEWLMVVKGVNGNQNTRLADTFHLQDAEFREYFAEFLKENEPPKQ